MPSISTPSISTGRALVLLVAAWLSGCVSDPNCGICDPDDLVLESVSGRNYADRDIHVLSPGLERGRYFVEELGACVETEAAQAAPRGPEEWCKLSPLASFHGLELVFNNLLDPTSVELIRRSPEDSSRYEVYDWKTRIAHIEGPITRFNGDYFARDEGGVVTRAVNLTCIDNLREQGIDYDHEVVAAEPDICEGFHEQGGEWLPLRMQLAGSLAPYEGETDARAGDCSTPSEGPDTCCDVCDFELSVAVAKYGLEAEGGARRSLATALTCTDGGDVYRDCAGFVSAVDRDDELERYRYEWAGELGEFRLPLSDKLRETHPDLRPPQAEAEGRACLVDADCDAQLGEDSGAVCIGQTAEGLACAAGSPGCGAGRCRAEWFVGCDAGVCVDRRFDDRGAGACYVAQAAFEGCEDEGECLLYAAGSRLALCDGGELSPQLCCQDPLGGEPGCDPLFQSGVEALPRFDRDPSLPTSVRACSCGDPELQHPNCAAQIERLCTPPWGTLERHDGASNEGDYITRFVTAPGGVIYDGVVKGVKLLPGDRGGERRSLVERCAERRAGSIGGRSVQDGWRMHDRSLDRPEIREDFDRALCSASSYRIVFADEGEHLRDKLGNVLEAHEREWAFETPEFHVVPGSGFPADSLRIGACDQFEIALSNKYELDPRNLRKIALVELERRAGVDDDGRSCAESLAPECWVAARVVAGGTTCSEDPAETLDEDGPPPCLSVDVSAQDRGVVRVSVDNVRFGARLRPAGEDREGRYRLTLPGLDGFEHFAELDLDDPEHLTAYAAAFHDVCGMPLITAGRHDYRDFHYDFSVDPNACPGSRGDDDRDDVQLSCDNAPEHQNPDQLDQDGDGVGDVVDRCVLTPSDPNNASDSDLDGLGNVCDSCPARTSAYNEGLALMPDSPLWVRNIPSFADGDGDGVGDVCDPCIVDPDPACLDPDTEQPWHWPDAAGPVGLEPGDDLDQDGLANALDGCPRQPLTLRIPCSQDQDCPGSSCAPTSDGSGWCNHHDIDGDGFGDRCDVCPFEPGIQDDADGDFIGDLCERGCETVADPRPHAFMEVSVGGVCCTAIYPGDGYYVTLDDGREACEGLCDPDGFPIERDCAPEDEARPGVDLPGGSLCRPLPAQYVDAAGITTLPPGCEDALALAGLEPWFGPHDAACDPSTSNCRLGLADYPAEQLRERACWLPQWDQDFDGVGDACDLCPFAFDPGNAPYVDEQTGKQWDQFGKFCSGPYVDLSVCE